MGKLLLATYILARSRFRAKMMKRTTTTRDCRGQWLAIAVATR